MPKETIQVDNNEKAAGALFYAQPSLAHITATDGPFGDALLYVDNANHTKNPAGVDHAPRPLARQVCEQHLGIWVRLKREALRARESYVYSARAATVAQFRGQGERSERLARLAYKQRMRWCDVSRALDFFEN